MCPVLLLLVWCGFFYVVQLVRAARPRSRIAQVFVVLSFSKNCFDLKERQASGRLLRCQQFVA